MPDVLRACEDLKSLRQWREGFQNKDGWTENKRLAYGIIHGERWREFRTALDIALLTYGVSCLAQKLSRSPS